MTAHTEHLIIGGGIIGLSAAWQLAKRGERVRLLERFGPHHTRGASHGSTRNINNAYHEQFYLDLFDEAFALWRELERDAPDPLLSLHGLVTQGDSATVIAAHDALAARGANVALLEPAEAAARWSGMRFAGPVLLSKEAGVGYAARALDALATAAERAGAVIDRPARAAAIEPGEHSVTVRIASDAGGAIHTSGTTTATSTIEAGSVTVAAGAWSQRLLSGLVDLPPLTVTEEHPAHFTPRDSGLVWPSFNHLAAPDENDNRNGSVYGMPSPGEGVKVGLHLVGHEVDPDHRTFGAKPAVRAAIREHVAEWFPGLDPDSAAEISCTYTSTSSGRFVLDRVGRITVAAGFSGHGYKFAPAVGRVLADAAMDRALPPEQFRSAAHNPHPR